MFYDLKYEVLCCNPSKTRQGLHTILFSVLVKVRLKDSLVSSLQFCKAKDTELAWIDGVLDMRVVKVDTGVILEEGVKDEAEESELAMDIAPDLDIDPINIAVTAQRAMKNLFGEDEKEFSEESDVIPTLEPLPPNEVGSRNLAVLNDFAVLFDGLYCIMHPHTVFKSWTIFHVFLTFLFKTLSLTFFPSPTMPIFGQDITS